MMSSDNKKISFGFSKLIKKQNISSQPIKIEKTVELVECLEGSEIKVKNAVEKIEKGPLVIPMKQNANHLAAQIEKESSKNKRKETKKEEEDTRNDSELTIEELAARQLLKEARNKLTQEKDTSKVHTLPLVVKNIEDGQEPTLEDFDEVPIADFGLAMLRGMGWKEGTCIGRNQSKCAAEPIKTERRPKGLGLGAQKVVNSEPKDVFDKNGEQLLLTKGAFAKIIAGSQKGTYCEIQGFEDSGKICVKTSKTNEILSLLELFLMPVTKEEYIIGSKIINNVKYEQYKEEEVNTKKNSHYPPKVERSNISQETERNGGYNNFTKQNIKTEKENSSREEKTLVKREKHKENLAEYDRKRSQERLKTKDRKQSNSRSKYEEKGHLSRKHSYEKEKKYSSENISSDDSYYSRRDIKGKGICDYSSDCSTSSDNQNNRKKSKKSKKDRKQASDSEYKSKKSKKESKRHKNDTKSKKYSKSRRDSSTSSSSSYEKYSKRKT